MIIIMELNRNFCGTFFGGLKETKKKRRKEQPPDFWVLFFILLFLLLLFFFIKQSDLKQVVDSWFDNGLCRKHCQHSGLCLRSYWPKFV